MNGTLMREAFRRARIHAVCMIAVSIMPVFSGLPADAQTITGVNHQVPQIVQFNTWGGKGNASKRFNADIWGRILNSIVSRNVKPYFLSLNEVCANGYNALAWDLGVAGLGYSSSNTSGYSIYHTVSLGNFMGGQIGEDLYGSCGTWYGNALFMRGAEKPNTGGAGWYDTSIQGSSGYGEKRNWICRSSAWSGRSACSTHTQPGCLPGSTVHQIEAYRGIGEFVSYGSGGVYVMGDLNCEPYLSGWQAAGFSEIQLPKPPGEWHETTDQHETLDYIWRRNTPAFSLPPYIATSDASDHHWVQAHI